MSRLPRLALAASTAALVLGLSSCGSDGRDAGHAAPAGPRRTVDVTMVDNEFMPRSITVEAGETVVLRFHNDGSMAHDAYLGDDAAQAEHEAEMMSDMGTDMGHYGDEDAATVEPGETGTITHTFQEGGRLVIGCHQPGHYAAGMRMAVRVS